LGALLSAKLSDSIGIEEGLNGVECFVGGFLMVFGSRMCGGCTSGHGLSGMALILWHSFIAVIAMFGAGIMISFTLFHNYKED